MRHLTVRPAFLPLALSLCLAGPSLRGQEGKVEANWALAEKFGGQDLRKFVYSTSVTPNWIGKTEKFWYSYRTSSGTRFWLVDAERQVKQPLFDHAALATALSVATKKAQLGLQLELSGLRIDDKGEKLLFTNDGHRFEYELAKGTLVDKGPAPATGPGGSGAAGRSDEGRQDRGERNEQQQEQQQQQQGEQEQRQGQQTEQQGQRGEGASAPAAARRERPDVALTSPDGLAFVVARDHELYFGEGTEETAVAEAAAKPVTEPAAGASAVDEKLADAKAEQVAKVADAKVEQVAKLADAKVELVEKLADAKAEQVAKVADAKVESVEKVEKVADAKGSATTAAAVPAEAGKPAPAVAPKKPRVRFDEATALKLSKDSVEGYTFASSGGSERGQQRGTGQRGEAAGATATAPAAPAPVRARPNATWSKDSKAFFATRRDTRGVQQLSLVNSLAEPRPAVQTYSYSMPGETTVSHSELWLFQRDAKALHRIERKWTHESYQNVHFFGDGHELRFVRRDRLQQNAEFCAVDPVTRVVRVLISESVENATLSQQSSRYLEKRKQVVWWSERSGWGHYYLHDAITGALINPITSGTFRASRLIDIDEEAGVLWFRGNGREPDENLNYDHLYRVNLDGTELVCLDAGDGTHNSVLSLSRRHVVDTYSRVDLEPRSVLRSGRDGQVLLALETTDLTKLTEMGWKMPERFTVKAADGVTDLFGNMWKPFDFDPARRYPLIVNVYPGPQQEGVTHTFSATAGTQQLAQLGFLVIQVGHRGGTPTRDKAYAAFGYGNLRDYGLEDKKTAIEQLANRHPYVDLTRIGLYGHSGGGFMTAAAMMKPPYNRFFKVGVASSGNHDNNIYNADWAERWHGLRQMEQDTATATKEGKEGKADAATTGAAGTASVGIGDKGEQQKGAATATAAATAKPAKNPFEIKVPTNAELAANLEGKLLLVHGEIDNNVHPANTMRLVDALIKANKRFDMLIVPGARHSFGAAQDYFRQRMFEYFAEHLLGDRELGADITRKDASK